jgi:AcrR family transcriptional regulator
MTTQRHIASDEETSTADRLLDAAYAAVMDVGLRRTTVADVARRAGVSRMTVYRQGADLDTLVGALLKRELVAVLDQAQQEVALLPTSRQRLVEASVLAVERIGRHPLYRRVLDLDPELLLPLIVDRFGSTQVAAREFVRQQLEKGQEDGSIRVADTSLQATCFLLAVQSFIFSARLVEPLGVSEELRRLLDGYLR